jgi:hypothetical protein
MDAEPVGPRPCLHGQDSNAVGSRVKNATISRAIRVSLQSRRGELREYKKYASTH